MRFLAIALAVIGLVATCLLAGDQHQAGSSASGHAVSGSACLESFLGQSAAGNSGILISGFATTLLRPAYLPGDADGNGILNISDAVFLIDYIFGGGVAPEPYASGDTDCSGLVNISDALVLIAHIFGGGPAPVYCY